MDCQNRRWLKVKRIAFFLLTGILLSAALGGRGYVNRHSIKIEEQQTPRAAEPPREENTVTLQDDRVQYSEKKASDSLVNSEGETLETRFHTPEGYARVLKPAASLQGFLRLYPMKKDGSPVLLYDGSQKADQTVHAAVFAMPLVEGDLQQCADSVMRVYGEYLWSMGAYDSIKFHLTNGFLMDYSSWRSGKRLSVNGNKVSWVQKASYNDTKESFVQYLRQVMVYAGTLSLDKECAAVDLNGIQAGDLFIRGGSPGHCVMVVDVAEDVNGNKCFLLAQGYMPAQEFHILKNPLHEADPWYYSTELQYPFITPEYVFAEGSLKRWSGFLEQGK